MATKVTDQNWVEALDLVVGVLEDLPLPEVQARCLLARSKFEAVEVRRLASEVAADGDDGRARRLAKASGGRSKRAARAAARRAKAVAKNRQLADDLASGELSEEKLDTIADAASNDDTAATDPDFIDAIKNRSVEAGRKLAKERRENKRSGESEHQRQRRLRSARRYTDRAAGLSAITIAGDDATIDELWRIVRRREMQLRELDGGRDVPSGQHPRTHEQRLFDALADVVRGAAGDGSGRPAAVLSLSIDGDAARLAGGGVVTDEYARELLARAGLSILLSDSTTGEPLWFGRARRHASAAQFLALIMRDQGCVQCPADWVGCEMHHLLPWTAMAAGNTDIDNLALLCVDCHQQLHADQLTLERLDDGTWKTRPATDDELPTPHPSRRRDCHPSPASSSSARGDSGTSTARATDSAAQSNPGLRARPGLTRIASDDPDADAAHGANAADRS